MSTIEERIKELLTMDVSARAFSDALFGLTGLFNEMAHTEEERRQLSQTLLFQQANSRLTELLKSEASEARKQFERRIRKERNGRVNSPKKSQLPSGRTGVIPTPRSSEPSPSKKHRKSG